jgi:hypothetical protein
MYTGRRTALLKPWLNLNDTSDFFAPPRGLPLSIDKEEEVSVSAEDDEDDDDFAFLLETPPAVIVSGVARCGE